MMLRVMLVDDDVVIRTNLKTMIEWEEYGFLVAGEAVNGEECLKKMANEQYELVITDMSMPVMGGVPLIDTINRCYPETEVIAISGYDDFEYVSNSLKKGAIDYLLKHKLNKQELCEVLHIARNKIMERDRMKHQQLLQSEQLAGGRTLMLRNLVNEMVSGSLSKEESIQRLEFLDISCCFKSFALCYIEAENFPSFEGDKKERVIRSFVDIVEKIIFEECTGFVSHLGENHFLALIEFHKINSILYIHQLLTTLVSRISFTAKKYMGFQLNISLSELCNHFERIPECFAAIRKSLERSFYEEKQQFVWAHREPVKPETQISLSIKDEASIQHFLEEGNGEKLMAFLEELFEKCHRENASVRSVQVICAELLSIAIQFCRKYNLDELRDELGALQLSGTYVKKKFADIRREMKSVYDRVIQQYYGLLAASGGNPYVKKAMQYVYTNFRKNISLTDVADYVGVSAQYLSKLIHEECDKSFSELLNGKRVEVACEMIRFHNYTIKEIAVATGFSNYNYFFKVFKEVTGMTPNEYEKRHT